MTFFSLKIKGREVDWVQCDGGCNKWFHMLCVGLVKSQMKLEDEFICEDCKGKRSTRTTGNTIAGNASRRLKSQTQNGSGSTTATANGNGNGTAGSNKRLTRSKEEGSREKGNSSKSIDSSVDISKINESKPNNNTKSNTQSVSIS